MAEINGVQAIRIVTRDRAQYEATLTFYRKLLGRNEDLAFGDTEDVHQAVRFRMGVIDLIVAREMEATPDAEVRQGPVWICFHTEDPDGALNGARQRGVDLGGECVDTAFDTRAFFTNDPQGLPIYVGTAWGGEAPAPPPPAPEPLDGAAV